MMGRIFLCVLAVGFLAGLMGCDQSNEQKRVYTEEERFDWTDEVPQELVGTWVMHHAGPRRCEDLRKIIIKSDHTVERIGGDANEPAGLFQVDKIRISADGRWIFYESGPGGERKAKYIITKAGLSESLEQQYGGWTTANALFLDNPK